MAVEAAVDPHRALHVDAAARLEKAEVRTAQGLFDSRYRIAFAVDGGHCEAYAVVGDALVDTQLGSERAAQGDVDISATALDSDNRGHCFNYS